jgi:DNA-binding NarL/FixJ family response regulator
MPAKTSYWPLQASRKDDGSSRHKSLKQFVEAYLSKKADATTGPVSPVALTNREREVIQLLAEGKSNKEVAGRLGISTRTAEGHRAEIMKKLQLGSLAELIRYAVRNSIIQP